MEQDAQESGGIGAGSETLFWTIFCALRTVFRLGVERFATGRFACSAQNVFEGIERNAQDECLPHKRLRH
jgi:hypothetical protein